MHISGSLNVQFGIIIGLGIAIMLGWVFLMEPELKSSPELVEFTTRNIGTMQVADENDVLGEPFDIIFEYHRHADYDENNNSILVFTSFNYIDATTFEEMWRVDLEEQLDKTTREYIDGREGYGMFPYNLEKIHYPVYDVGGAIMQWNFIESDYIGGLEVYKFSGSTIFDISDIYPEYEQTILEEYKASEWVEPTTGLTVKLEEEFTDFYIKDGQRIPILYAQDVTPPLEIAALSNIAQAKKSLFNAYDIFIPSLILIFMIIALGVAWFSNRNTSQNKMISTISHEKVIAQNLLEQSKILERQKAEFAAMLSHELKTPLTPISLWCDALLEEEMLGKITPEQKNAVQTIRNSAEELKALIEDIFAMQKLELNELQLRTESFSINELLQDLEENLATVIRKKNIKFVNSMNEKIEIVNDKRRLGQILRNLILNAVDFVPEGVGRIEVGVSASGDSIKLFVKDNGSGISIDNQKKLFKKFSQVDASHTREHGGTGLGLAICRGLVDLMNGKIWVESEIHKGSTFFISIPKEITITVAQQQKN